MIADPCFGSGYSVKARSPKHSFDFHFDEMVWRSDSGLQQVDYFTQVPNVIGNAPVGHAQDGSPLQATATRAVEDGY